MGYEHEEFVHSVVLAPSERVVVDVQFTDPGSVRLEHHPPTGLRWPQITVTAEPSHRTWPTSSTRCGQRGHGRRTRRITAMLDAAPAKTVAFVAEMDIDAPDIEPGAAVVYICPMHPEVSERASPAGARNVDETARDRAPTVLTSVRCIPRSPGASPAAARNAG